MEYFPLFKRTLEYEIEIKYLSEVFDDIYIMPNKGSGVQRPVPPNVKILPQIERKPSPRILMYIYGIMNLLRLLLDENLKENLKYTTVFMGIKYLGYGIIIKKKIEKNFKKNASIHYSYWLNYNAFALSMLKREKKIKILISRAHGFDLYEERGEKSLTFIKLSTISYLDKLFAISEHGLNYLMVKYSKFSNRFSFSRLGTPEPKFINPNPNNKSLIIASCFILRPVKRISLILESLKIFSHLFPSVSVVWYHLGGGSGLNKLISDARSVLKGSNVQYYLTGNKTNAQIFDFYKTQAVDIFLNTSESEGLPVSIMEAQSFGLPVIATAVGGTPEIVNNENGFLLPVNPTPDEIADALYDVYSNQEKWIKKRELSRKNWEENFNAEKNYKAFANELKSLIETN